MKLNKQVAWFMYKTTTAKLRVLLATLAIGIAIFAACNVIWPLWISSLTFQVSGAAAGRVGNISQNLTMIGSILSLTCIAVVSTMLPETTTIEASMAQIAENIAEPGSLVSGVEREVASNLDRIIALLKSHSEVGRLYTVSLEKAGRNLIELTSPEQLRVAIGYLIAENNKMRKETGNLQTNLKESHEKIENLRENLEVAEETGMRDSLTSLWNRRAFDKMLALQVESAPKKNSPLSIILADIDHFKRINDNFGHLIGDEILRLVASTISKNVKGRDFIARFGGEEFAIILPQTSLENAIKLAMQIKQQLEIQKWVVSKRNEVVGTITASFGISQLQPGENRSGFLGRADKKLYEAKEAGRNRIAS
jgi:diguanylate cyclase